MSATPAPTHRFAHAWKALRHRNFRLFFFGQGTSVLGTSMTSIATSWLVFRLTHSALLLGWVGFSSQIVPFLISPFAGVWVERLDRRTVMLATQSAACVQSLALAALTLTHRITLAEIIALSAFQGFINAFDAPARHALLINMVGNRDDLANAIALNSSMVNGARLIGPAIAGVIIAAVGEGWCFLIDGVSYFAVIASLLMMHLAPRMQPSTRSGMLAQMREGFDYVRTTPSLRSVLVLFSIIAFMGYPYTVLLPVFAAGILHGGPHTLGSLAAASGVGAFFSAISLALRRHVRGLTTMLPVAAITLGIALIFFGVSRHLWLSLFLMLFAGFGFMQVASATNTVLQSLVTDDKRARVISFYAMAFYGAAPFGSLFGGALAHRFGAPTTVILTGSCCLAGAAWFLIHLRHVEADADRIYRSHAS